MALVSAGLYTIAADNPQWSLNGPVHQSSSAMPRGTFPHGVSFQLRTPRSMGIGSIVLNEFRRTDIEREPYGVVAQERAGNFARGRGALLHYCHMQQKAKYLIPSLPVHSRVDELNRVHSNARRHELQRTLALESLEMNEQRRRSRLHQAKTILQSKSLSKEVSQRLQASMSLPNLEEPCGEQTPVFELLNRRVDVNRIKRCRSEAFAMQKAQVVKQAVTVGPELKELVDDIARFEDDNLPGLNLVLETVVDWKNSNSISFGGGMSAQAVQC